MNAIPVEIPTVPFFPTRIPDRLKQEPRWNPWLLEAEHGKVPYQRTGLRVSTAKPEKWTDFTDALTDRMTDEFSGVGYLMTGPHGIVGIDLDKCIDADGTVAEWAQTIVDRMATYTETSPSGRGLRMFCTGWVPHDWCNHTTGIEVYGGHKPRFLTVTGCRVPGSPEDVQEAPEGVLEALEAEHGKGNVVEIGRASLPALIDAPDLSNVSLPEDVRRFLDAGEHDGDRSAILHKTGIALFSEGLSDAEVFSVLMHNEFTFEVAMDKRRQDEGRAELYLWREHCEKAKPKAVTFTASDFQQLPPEENGRPVFRRDKQGRILGDMDNTMKAVGNASVIGMSFHFDDFHGTTMVDKLHPLEDHIYAEVERRLDQIGFKSVTIDRVRRGIHAVAIANRYDSAKEWLSGLQWDGVPRIARFYQDYLGCEDNEYSTALGRYTWTGLAARTMDPGCQMDMVPVWISPEGRRKSALVAAISPERFNEMSFHEPPGELIRKMRGSSVVELSELAGLAKREMEAVKAWITKRCERWTPKFIENTTSYHRRCLFIGTSNRSTFLSGEDENRRFLPIEITRGDLEKLTQDRDQLWAEALIIWQAEGTAWEDAERLGREKVKLHVEEDPWQEMVAEWLEAPWLDGKNADRKDISTSLVLQDCLRVPGSASTISTRRRLATVFRRLGWHYKHNGLRTEAGNKSSVWRQSPQVE